MGKGKQAPKYRGIKAGKNRREKKSPLQLLAGHLDEKKPQQGLISSKYTAAFHFTYVLHCLFYHDFLK